MAENSVGKTLDWLCEIFKGALKSLSPLSFKELMQIYPLNLPNGLSNENYCEILAQNLSFISLYTVWENYSAEFQGSFGFHPKTQVIRSPIPSERFLFDFWEFFHHQNSKLTQGTQNKVLLVSNKCPPPRDIGDQLLDKSQFLSEYYPRFLKYHSPEEQKSRGILYTPKIIIDYIYRNINELLTTACGIEKGLYADSLLYYDPAVGSLGFEQNFLQQRITTHRFDKEAIAKLMVSFSQRFYGNELNIPAFYVGAMYLADNFFEVGSEVSHKQLFQNFQFETALSENLPVILKKKCHSGNFFPIIIGNPPYSVSSGNKNPFIYNLLKSYAVQEPNITRLYDDYVKFIRYAQYVISEVGYGIIGFVTNRKFLDGKIYYGMRRTLLEFFDKIYITDLQGDARNPKSGGFLGNVFKIQTGVCITIFIKVKTNEVERKTPQIYYRSLEEGEQSVSDFLTQPNILENFLPLSPARPTFLFVPQEIDNRLRNLWQNEFIALPECFQKTSRAMISSRDRFMIHSDRTPLEQNIKLLQARDYKGLRELGRIRSSSDPLLEDEEILQSFDFRVMADSIHQINYRPFDIRHGIYYTINKKCGKSIILDHLIEKEPLNLRQNTCAACDDFFNPDFFDEPAFSNTVALNFVQSIQKPPFSHIFLTRGLVDSGLFGYSTSKCSPLWIHGAYNISAELMAKMRAIDPEVEPSEIIGYIYAILNCSHFLSRYEPFLLHEYPRIPVNVSADFFHAFSEKGTLLLHLHIQNLHKYEIKLIEELSHQIWAGTDFSLTKFSYDEKTEKILLIAKGANMQISIPCSPAMWAYRIGSVQILANWCKSRRHRILKRKLRDQDLWELAIIIYSVNRTLEIKTEIDAIFKTAGLIERL